MSDQITPFQIQVPDSELEDLRRRLAATRWPDEEPVSDWSQGIPRAYLREVVAYWGEKYDWRAREAYLNSFAQYRTEVDGLGIHFVHVAGLDRRVPQGDRPAGGSGRTRRQRRVTPSTSCVRRCRATASPTSRARRAGASEDRRHLGRS